MSYSDEDFRNLPETGASLLHILNERLNGIEAWSGIIDNPKFEGIFKQFLADGTTNPAIVHMINQQYKMTAKMRDYTAHSHSDKPRMQRPK